MEQAIINIEDDLIDGKSLVKRDELNAYEPKHVGPDPVHPGIITTIVTEFNLTLRKVNTVYKNGWIQISHTSQLNTGKEVTDVTLRVNSITGTKTLEPVINYPSAETWNGQPYVGFLLKDSDGLLSETNDWDIATLSYNIKTNNDTNPKYDGTKQVLGNGVISDHNSIVDTAHSNWTLHAWWDTVYPEFKGVRIQSEQNVLTNYGGVAPNFTPTLATKTGCELILRPYTGASYSENPGSNANLFTVGAHGGNLYNGETVGARKNNGFVPDTDLSENYRPEFFFDNLVLVSACKEEGTTLEQAPTQWNSTHGYGCEFYEKLNQQSPTTAVVGAKMKKIKDLTGCNWSIVRLACRKTASTTTMAVIDDKKIYTYHWNQYMGFGIIDVDAAIAYINENYKSQAYRDMLADDLEGNRGLASELQYEDLFPNSPVAKRMIEDKLSNVDFLNFPVVNPTIIGGISISENTVPFKVVADKTIGFKTIDGAVKYGLEVSPEVLVGGTMLSIPKSAKSLAVGYPVGENLVPNSLINQTFSGDSTTNASRIINLIAGKTYTLSVNLKLSNIGSSVDIYLHNNDWTFSLNISYRTEIVDTIKTIAVSVPTTGVYNLDDFVISGSNTLNWYKLEEGSVATPNILDVNSKTLGISGSLNLSELKELETLNVANNAITEVSVDNSKGLKTMDVSNTDVESLKLINLKDFTYLNANRCTKLITLFCDYGNISSLLLSGCIKLSQLVCKFNKITSLDLSDSALLTQIYANNNNLTDFSLVGLSSLRELYLDFNLLTTLEKPNSTIQYLTASSNQLVTQDLSGLNQLVVADFRSNLLTSVDVAGCSSLTALRLQNNLLSKVEIESIIAQVTASVGNNTNVDYPNRLEFIGNPGSVEMIETDYELHNTKGWIISF